MFDPEFVKYLSTLGVGGAIAGLLFMFYRKDVKTFTDQWKGQTEMTMRVLQDNTAAITANTEVMRSVQHNLDHIACLNLDPGADRDVSVSRQLPAAPERRSFPRKG